MWSEVQSRAQKHNKKVYIQYVSVRLAPPIANNVWYGLQQSASVQKRLTAEFSLQDVRPEKLR